MLIYPSREPFYSHKFTRLLFKSCAAQSLGRDAVLLLIHIVHTEDAARYQGPVRFWNSQLNEVLGFNSPKSLNNARDKAVEAGWLVYKRKHTRAVGSYFTTIPTSVQLFDDEPIEPIEAQFFPSTERVPEQITPQEGYGSRPKKVTNSGKPSNPIPNPNPILSPGDDEQEFLNQWKQIKGVSPIRKFTPARRQKLLARLRDKSWPWHEALAMLPLAGDGWQPDFDWIIANEDNVLKILEGKYAWRAGKNKSPSKLVDD
jgi:hypothetical protein